MTRVFKIVTVFLAAQFMALAAMAQDGYSIKPGDVVRVEVLEDSSLNRESLVLPDGRITVPLAGTVAVGGRTVDQVRSDVTQRLSSNFASDPTVTVSLVQLGEAPKSTGTYSSDIEVYFMGEINTPGLARVEKGTTLLQALAIAGGFSRFAATKRVQLRRTDSSGVQKVYAFNYDDVLAGRTSIGGTVLAKGDVIVVPARKLFE
ncbi:polysaccharide export protein [Sulfitobacter sp. BDSS02]|uniref:polysaccharide biosynthesis/export family protein n=1 Tax=Heliomarina TaxID=2917553 RepID=UPI001EE37DA7|nr:polysaccharide biosynthesis/export family protein [Heliomarina baculiformis]MBL3701252.1 polysaccharide export protein [Sulfitobacter sp. BDSS02]MBR9848090.1 polysaccharide export protein [Paracoccaceae bacterium]